MTTESRSPAAPTPDPLRLDGVVPPDAQGPVELVWRRMGRRRDRVSMRINVIAMYVVILAIYLLATSGIHRPPLGELLIGLILFGGGAALQQYGMANGRSYIAAGRWWLAIDYGGRKRRHLPATRWVRLDALQEITVKSRRSFARIRSDVHFTDAEGRHVVIDARRLQPCRPIVALIDEAIAAAGQPKKGPNVDETLHRKVRQEGQLIARSGQTPA